MFAPTPLIEEEQLDGDEGFGTPGHSLTQMTAVQASLRLGRAQSDPCMPGSSSSVLSRMESLDYGEVSSKELAEKLKADEESDEKDVSRGRKYLRDVAERHKILVYPTVQLALDAILEWSGPALERMAKEAAAEAIAAASRGMAREAPLCVFLGGACNPTTWRFDSAMPFLDAHGISYYNPQVKEWNSGLVAAEAKAKDQAKALLFVIAHNTRGIASMIETSEYISQGDGDRTVFLVIEELEEEDGFRHGNAGLLLQRVQEFGTLRKPKQFGVLRGRSGEAAQVKHLKVQIAKLETDLIATLTINAELQTENSEMKEKLDAVKSIVN